MNLRTVTLILKNGIPSPRNNDLMGQKRLDT